VFATRTYRYIYVGQRSSEKPQWLKQNPEKWRRKEDVPREAASLAASVETEVNVVAASSGPNSQTSSHDLRKDGGDESDVTFVDTSADDSSPACQPESVPAPMDQNVPSRPTQTELPPSAEAATSETNEFETGTTPLEETERKQGRAGRQRKKLKLSAKVLKARRKRMRVVVESLRECPVLSDAASKAGIHRKTLEYWIKRSKAGDDGYDIEQDGLMWKFHELVEFAIEEAHDQILEVAWKIAMGELYKKDGDEVPHLYVRRPNGKMMRFLLEWKFPEKYGKHPKIDIPQKTGVVLIGDTPKKPATCPEASLKTRKWKSMSAMVRKTKA
jgi:hypothetical protein